MADSTHRRTGVIGLVVLLLLAAGAVVLGIHRTEDPGTPFLAADVTPALRSATVDLIGYAPDGPPSLEDALAVATRSVADMATLDDAAFVETWERSAPDQAELVGRWLGLAARELGGGDRESIVDAAPDLIATAPDDLRDTMQTAYDAASG